jgi:hypothetical protein
MDGLPPLAGRGGSAVIPESLPDPYASLREQNPRNWVPLLDRELYTRRRLKLICVGAGFSGLTLAYKIKHEHELSDALTLTIYEKNADVGGTWYENVYPGVAW